MNYEVHAAFAGGLRSELLRYFSGYSVLGILAFSGLVPWFVANFLGWPDHADKLSSAQNVETFWALATTIAIVAMFAGSYLVTREAYFGTLQRSVAISGMSQLVMTKYAASLVVGLFTAASGLALWSGGTALAVSPEVRTELVDGASWQALLGVVAASVVGCLWGCSLGWIIRHYYATTIATMLIPLALELPLMANFPEIARWLPSGALAGIANLPIEGLFGPLHACLVSLGWLIAGGTGAMWVLRRRGV